MRNPSIYTTWKCTIGLCEYDTTLFVGLKCYSIRRVMSSEEGGESGVFAALCDKGLSMSVDKAEGTSDHCGVEADVCLEFAHVAQLVCCLPRLLYQLSLYYATDF